MWWRLRANWVTSAHLHSLRQLWMGLHIGGNVQWRMNPKVLSENDEPSETATGEIRGLLLRLNDSFHSHCCNATFRSLKLDHCQGNEAQLLSYVNRCNSREGCGWTRQFLCLLTTRDARLNVKLFFFFLFSCPLTRRTCKSADLQGVCCNHVTEPERIFFISHGCAVGSPLRQRSWM